MKTKMKLHLIIYITIVGFLTACENEIPYNPGQQDPQIIMNALLETGQAENDVYLHLGEGYSIEHLNEATLFLYINGKIAETPKAVSPEEIYGHLEGELDKDIYESLLKSIRFKKYRLTSTLHPGDNIRLEATAENGKYHASAEVTVPQPIESLHVDTCLAYLREYSGKTLTANTKLHCKTAPTRRTTTGWTFGMTVVTIANGKNIWRMKTAASSKWKTRTALGIGPPYLETLPSLLPGRTKSSTGKMLY